MLPLQFQESDILLSSGSAEIEGVYPCVSTWKALWFPYNSCESAPSGTHSVTLTLTSLHHSPFEISLALGGPRDPKPDGFVLRQRQLSPLAEYQSYVHRRGAGNTPGL